MLLSLSLSGLFVNTIPIHVSNQLLVQVHALPLTGHLAFSSVVLLSSLQHQGLALFRNIRAICTMAMATHNMAAEGLLAYLLALGSAALKLVLGADYWEESWCHRSLLRRCGALPDMPESCQRGDPLAAYPSAGEAGWSKFGRGGRWEMMPLRETSCCQSVVYLTPVQGRSASVPAEFVISLSSASLLWAL